MSEFSELIKHFDKIRDYMRDFYVYGFRSREYFAGKSTRSYDNEKRRIESYLKEYMAFYQEENGKCVFISVDGSQIPANPLFRAFKAKTFTKNDIALHFFILDILMIRERLTAREVADIIAEEYSSYFEEPMLLDLATVRNKLVEYGKLGLLNAEKQGKKLLYSRNQMDIDLDNIKDALVFFSEVSSVGVVGSFLLDKCSSQNQYLSFKHHYIMHALESDIVYQLLEAMQTKRTVEIVNQRTGAKSEVTLKLLPLKFLISVQGGRRYLSAYSYRSKAILNFRLDYIKSVKLTEESSLFEAQQQRLMEILDNTWGASFGRGRNPERLALNLYIEPEEHYIVNRIQREGRNGTLSQIGDTTYRYEIVVYDAVEMIPWIRSFIGRILSLECDNKAVTHTFSKDMEALYAMYSGGETDVV